MESIDSEEVGMVSMFGSHAKFVTDVILYLYQQHFNPSTEVRLSEIVHR